MELISARNTTTQTTVAQASARRRDGESGALFHAAGAARRLRAGPLLAIGRGEPGPALRRGALVAAPIGVALAIGLGFDAPTQGAVASAALITGFIGLDAPAGPRAAWLAASAPGEGEDRRSAAGALSERGHGRAPLR